MTSPCNPLVAPGRAQPARIRICPTGSVEDVSAPAAQVLDANKTTLWIAEHRLATTDPARLTRCLQRARSGRPSALSLCRPDRLPLTLLAIPAPERPVGAVQIALRDPEAELPALNLLRDLFDLTPVEARVTRLLSAGRRTADIALELQVRPNTVHAHLKSVYGKTGCRHQAALLSLVLRSVAMQAVSTPGRAAAPFPSEPAGATPLICGIDACALPV